MPGFDDPAFYGDRWAEVYDERHSGLDPSAAVEFLAGLSGGGRVLELAIGTGRLRVHARGWATLDERMMPLCPGEIIVCPCVQVPWAWPTG
jgi:hypothetical protein